jgi:hypothetical protein
LSRKSQLPAKKQAVPAKEMNDNDPNTSLKIFQPLFIIERSKNAKFVHYDAFIDHDGKYRSQ